MFNGPANVDIFEICDENVYEKKTSSCPIKEGNLHRWGKIVAGMFQTNCEVGPDKIDVFEVLL